jgi:hypothetical protein
MTVTQLKCPHCGKHFSQEECKPLTPTHNWPKITRQVCPGSQQQPRNAETDHRPLWKDLPKEKQP